MNLIIIFHSFLAHGISSLVPVRQMLALLLAVQFFCSILLLEMQRQEVENRCWRMQKAVFGAYKFEVLCAVRLLDDGLLGQAEVKQGLLFITQELTCLQRFGDPTSSPDLQQLWLAYSDSLSEPPRLCSQM